MAAPHGLGKNYMEASLIILTYNSSSYIEDLLSELTKIYKKQLNEGRLEIIVADNDSKDDTEKKIKNFENASFIQNGENAGYAKGNNLASKKAKGEILIFLNPDTKIVAGDIFEMLSVFTDERVGVVGGKILSSGRKQELSCGKTYSWFNCLLLSLGLEESFGVRFAPEKTQDVDFVAGTFLAIRKDLFESLKGFDEHYFMYVEDADLCFRVKREGRRVVFSPEATIQHVGQGSSNRAFAIVNIYKGLLYFQKKHMGKISYNIVKFLLSLKAIILVLLGKISNNQYLAATYEEAFKAIR